MEVDATDEDGISQVQFYAGSDGTFLLTTDNTAPYTHTFQLGGSTGEKTFRAVATDSTGLTAEVTMTFTVLPESATPPTADFTMTPTDGDIPLDISFDASASADADGTIVSYDWDFGDGNTGTGQTPTHTYTIPGSYTATLTVVDNDGSTDTYAVGGIVARGEALCNLIQTTDDLNPNFASPLDDSNNLIFSANCSEDTITLTAGQNDPDQIILDYGYYWNGSSWQQYSLAPTVNGSVLNDFWLRGEASATITRSSLTKPGFILAHVCSWNGIRYECPNRWTLQETP
jgi:PKD repeat protein